jgi:hypothetical protein
VEQQEQEVVVDSKEEGSNPVSSFLGLYRALGEELVKKSPVGTERVGDRQFNLVNGRTIFGVVFEETDDAFLILRPTMLTSETEDGPIDGKLIVHGPMIRLMKTSVVLITIPDAYHRYHYYKFLLKIKNKSQQLFSEEVLSAILESVEEFESKRKSPSRAKTPAVGATQASSDWIPHYISKAKH